MLHDDNCDNPVDNNHCMNSGYRLSLHMSNICYYICASKFCDLCQPQNYNCNNNKFIVILWQYSLLFNFGMTVKHTVSIYTPAISQPGENLVTVLPAVLVPACAVLIVGAVTVVACVMRRRQSVVIKSRDGVDMISANREQTGFVDT